MSEILDVSELTRCSNEAVEVRQQKQQEVQKEREEAQKRQAEVYARYRESCRAKVAPMIPAVIAKIREAAADGMKFVKIYSQKSGVPHGLAADVSTSDVIVGLEEWGKEVAAKQPLTVSVEKHDNARVEIVEDYTGSLERRQLDGYESWRSVNVQWP